MINRTLLTILGYGLFVFLPFIYILMTVHHLLNTDMNPISGIAAAEAEFNQAEVVTPTPKA